ncbi:MAG: MFS transporter [Verrucomicrobia bacterium]|nr:MFS transporter [Verrucomicrobiota bacterium]
MDKNKFLRLIQVKPKEAKIVFLSFVFAFCIGAVQNILFSIPLAMFLSRYSSSYLPQVYIATGIATFFVGLAFGYLEKKASVFYVLALPIAIFSATLYLFWGLLHLFSNPLIFISLLILSLLIASLIISIVMLLINQLFTFQQSKRIYGLIFGGIALGGVAIGFGMEFLIRTIGSNQIILLAALLLTFAFLMEFPIRKNSSGRLLEVEGEASTTKASWKSFKNKKYILQVFLFTIFVFFIYYAFDLLFNTAVQQRYPAQDEMAVFFGIIFAVYDIASLLAAFVIATWILSRFGLIFALISWPLGLTIMLSAVLAIHAIPAVAGMGFSIIIAAAVFDVMFREAIMEQSILLLFQPLRPVPRAWAQLKNETIITPIATAVIGAILMVVEKYFGIALSVMSLMIIGLCICGTALVLLVLRKGYLKLLMESLSKRVISNPQFTRLTKDSLNVLRSHLQSIYPEEAIYVLGTIEKVDSGEFQKMLGQSLDSQLEQVRIYSLSKIEQKRMKGFEGRLSGICQTEKSPAVLGAALVALASTTDLEKYAWFKQYLHDPNLEVVQACLTALIRYGSQEKKNEAMQILKEKAKSARKDERVMVAQVLKSAVTPGKAEILSDLLQDSNVEVRDVAVQAAMHLSDSRLYHLLIQNLEIPHLHDSAMQTLSSFGKGIFDYIVKEFDQYSTQLQIHLVTILGFIKGAKPIEFLEKLLPTANRRLLHATLQSLKRLSYKATDEEMIQRLIESENENILFLKEMIIPLHFEKMKILHDFLCREIELSQECCFFLLAFVYPDEAIMQAKLGLSLDDEETNSNAVELLLQTIEMKDQRLLIDQLNYFPYKQEGESASNEVEIKDLLLKVRDYTANCFIPALPAAVIYEIGILKLKSMMDVVVKQELKGDTLMQEIQPLSLKKLETA